MNVYDFDQTIYWGDSSIRFYFYCLIRKPYIMFIHSLKVIAWSILYILGLYTFTEFKERLYSFTKKINDIDNKVDKFWEKERYRIKDFYLHNQTGDDVVISASFDFLLKPICDKLGIKTLMCTKYDVKKGLIIGKNVNGFQKLHLYKNAFKKVPMLSAYSDSGKDLPILEYAKKGYVVRGSKIIPVDKYKFSKRILNKYSKRKH